MKRALLWLAVLALGIGVLASVPQAEAQSGGTYSLTWSTIDGGTMPSAGGSYTLNATIGQVDADVLNNGPFALNGGFWLNNLFQLYLPLILK